MPSSVHEDAAACQRRTLDLSPSTVRSLVVLHVQDELRSHLVHRRLPDAELEANIGRHLGDKHRHRSYVDA
jgi:hypothetical protein